MLVALIRLGWTLFSNLNLLRESSQPTDALRGGCWQNFRHGVNSKFTFARAGSLPRDSSLRVTHHDPCRQVLRNLITRWSWFEPMSRGGFHQSFDLSQHQIFDDCDGKLSWPLRRSFHPNTRRICCPPSAMCAADTNMNVLKSSQVRRVTRAALSCTSHRMDTRSTEWTSMLAAPRSRC